MTYWPRSLTPRTLGAQMIVVTAVAVLVSNIAVATWFELGREQESKSSFISRFIERAVSAASVLSAIPPKQREAAAKAMSSVIWRFEILHGKPVSEPMTPAERALVVRARALLPAERQKQIIDVQINPRTPKGDLNWRKPPSQTITQITLPVVRGTQLVTTLFEPQPGRWPAEILLAALASVITASVAAAVIARRVSRPLSELSAAASEAAHGGAPPRVPEVGPEDIKRAATAFNAMTDQVTRTLESQRQLLSAVGHDLRTPITAIRINIEFIEDAELRDRLERNLEELQDLTEAVLSAVKGAGGERARNVDIAALIESLCADLDDLNEPVKWTPHGPAPCPCRPNEIRRAVRNLIENAVAYGKEANVTLKETPDGYDILVDDHGPGIPANQQEQVFEPFVRLESSRSSETGGTGLGLTLVRAIAEGHGGSIAVENRDDGGLRARLHLPRQTVAA